LDVPGISCERRSEKRPWKSAPVTATPSEPPTMRPIDSTPDATPAFVTSTAFIAAVDIGDITRPIPSPIRTNAPTRKP